MFDKNVVRRRRAALAVFVGLSLVLLTVYFGESGGGILHTLQRGAQQAISPLQSGASRALKPVRDLFGWVGDTVDAKGDNDELRSEVEALRKDLAGAETDRRDAVELRGLVGLAKQSGFPADVEPVTARVIARSPSVWYSSVQIDAGSADGVKRDQPVVTSGGLAGKVTSVTGGTARVTLILDSTSAVSAQVVPNGTSGVAKPQVGKPTDLLLDFIDRKRKVTKGATVITSGFTSSKVESLFPRGIPIGRVSKVEPDEFELYQRVHIRPFADLRKMDFVQVLTRANDERAESRP